MLSPDLQVEGGAREAIKLGKPGEWLQAPGGWSTGQACWGQSEAHRSQAGDSGIFWAFALSTAILLCQIQGSQGWWVSNRIQVPQGCRLHQCPGRSGL